MTRGDVVLMDWPYSDRAAILHVGACLKKVLELP
jgi:hypothetical protein